MRSKERNNYIPGFERNNYFTGKFMTANDCTIEQGYLNRKRWLINRTLFGVGVAFGFSVTPGRDDCELVDEIVAGAGLALDPLGREIFLGCACRLSLDKLVLPDGDCDTGRYVLRAHYAERDVKPARPAPDPCAEEDGFGRLEEGVVFTLARCDEAADAPCPPSPLDDTCKSLHQYLCERADDRSKLWIDQSSGCICPPGRPQGEHCGWRFDKDAGVPIAVVELYRERPDCCLFKAKIDNCGARSLAHSTASLYELIHGYHADFPRIEAMNWVHQQEMMWDEFVERCSWQDGRGFKVWFDKPVRRETINEFSVAFSVIVKHGSERYWVRHFVPICFERFFYEHGGCIGFWFYPVKAWWEQECNVQAQDTKLEDGGYAEIWIYGDEVTDDCGRALDANLIWRGKPEIEHGRAEDIVRLCSGNGTQGGTFRSVIPVAGPRSRLCLCEDMDQMQEARERPAAFRQEGQSAEQQPAVTESES